MKEQVQQRISQKGEKLPLEKFSWDERTNTFSSSEDDLVIDFADQKVNLISGNDSTQTAGNDSTQKAGYRSTQTAGNDSTQKASACSTQKAGYRSTQTDGNDSTQKAGDDSTQTAGYRSTQTAGNDSTQTAGYGSTQKAGACSTQKAGDDSTQKAGYRSTQTAGYGSTQKAGDDSTQTAGYGSKHTIGSNSQVTTGYESVINVNGDNVVIINRNVFEVILAKKGDIIQICPKDIAGHLVNGRLNGVPHIIADGILSRIVSKKSNVYKVINYREKKESYLVEREDGEKKIYAHGNSLKQARDSLMYKIGNRATSYYKNMNLDSILTLEESIKLYRIITGACEKGVKDFINKQNNLKNKYKISELIQLTRGEFGNEVLKNFFNK